ncbi:MAG: exodeoxyribonuclease VII large subunit [Cognaticolwellia sp.]|jgi:exodeoxyribonuclease VII large subunit
MKHTLLELNQFLNRIVVANLPEPVWVTCEIMQINNSRGHYYIDLIEKDEITQQIVAQSQAVMWSGTYYRLKKKIGANFKNLLQSGIQVLVEVKVDFSARYGLKLVIENIDPAYTLGQMELQRQATIEQLKKEDLFKKNNQLILPKVPQRIAVISSSKAAGLQDFLQELTTNQYDYDIKYHLFEAAMQGQFSEKEIINALREIEKQKGNFDAVVLIRGGGSKLDLSGFDSLKICRTLANFPLPVLTGIGHEIDESISDLVAHSSLKTPTAVATFLIERFLNYELKVNQLHQLIGQNTQSVLNRNSQFLEQIEQGVKYTVKTQLFNAERMVDYIDHEIPKLVKSRLRLASSKLALIEKTVELLNPKNTLKRGFSMTTKNGKIITSRTLLKENDIIETHFADGKIQAKVL